ncbi:MAG: bifunctional pyr operon transcriptional regulator/uracil phosphoribosyltransferase PyrR [Spirochaetota bacterium]
MTRECMNSSAMNAAIVRMAREFCDREKDASTFAFIGIRSRGDIIMERFRTAVSSFVKTPIDTGTLDITFYRDDLSRRIELPEVKETRIPFDITNRKILLIDDVFFTGRTIRAAMNALFDYGRPSLIRLLVLVDRGARELPIVPDYIGTTVDAKKDDIVNVTLAEKDGTDAVIIQEKRA